MTRCDSPLDRAASDGSDGRLPRAGPPGQGARRGSGPRTSRTPRWATERGTGYGSTALVDVLESTGSDVYAHLALAEQNGHGAFDDPHVREVQAAAPPVDEPRSPTRSDVIARLDSSSRIGEGRQAELWMDTSRIHLFDPDTRRAHRALSASGLGRWRRPAMIAILGGLGAALAWAISTLCSSRSSRMIDPLVGASRG